MKLRNYLFTLTILGLTSFNTQAVDFQCPDFATIYQHIKSVNDSYTVNGLTWYCVPDNCNLHNLTKNSEWQTESSFYKLDTLELILQCTNTEGTYSIVANAGTDFDNCHLNNAKLTPGNVTHCHMMGKQKCPPLECERKQI